MNDGPTLVVSLAEFADPRIAAGFVTLAQALAADHPVGTIDDLEEGLRVLQATATTLAAENRVEPELPMTTPPVVLSLTDVSFVLAALLDALARLLKSEVSTSVSEAWVIVAERTITMLLLASEIG